MYHSITFAELTGGTYTNDEAVNADRKELSGMLKGYNTWYDWHLIPTSRPTIAHPEVLTKFVQIPGKSGQLDLTNYVCTKSVYANRTGTLQFYAIEEYTDYRVLRTEMMRILHGRKLRINLEDDPLYYYVGRIDVNGWVNEKSRPKISITYNLEPYKYSIATGERQMNDL